MVTSWEAPKRVTLQAQALSFIGIHSTTLKLQSCGKYWGCVISYSHTLVGQTLLLAEIWALRTGI